MKKDWFKILSGIVFLIAIVVLVVIALPLLKMAGNPEEFKRYIDGFGAWSLVMMLFVQIAQIVVALIPGEVVEFVAGVLYGCFGGLVFCLVGIAVGQTLIFKMVKYLGSAFVEKVAGSKVMEKFQFLQDEKKLKSILFILFFIPGTPKDLLTYIVPLTKIKFRDFLVITLLARIPSVVSSTYAGSALADGDYVKMIIIYAVIIVFSLCGVIAYRFIDTRLERKREKISEEKSESVM